MTFLFFCLTGGKVGLTFRWWQLTSGSISYMSFRYQVNISLLLLRKQTNWEQSGSERLERIWVSWLGPRSMSVAWLISQRNNLNVLHCFLGNAHDGSPLALDTHYFSVIFLFRSQVTTAWSQKDIGYSSNSIFDRKLSCLIESWDNRAKGVKRWPYQGFTPYADLISITIYLTFRVTRFGSSLNDMWRDINHIKGFDIVKSCQWSNQFVQFLLIYPYLVKCTNEKYITRTSYIN